MASYGYVWIFLFVVVFVYRGFIMKQCEGCKEEVKQVYTIEDFSGYYCEHCYDELQSEMTLEAEGQQGD